MVQNMNRIKNLSKTFSLFFLKKVLTSQTCIFIANLAHIYIYIWIGSSIL